ncbi:hypothetical protein FACS189426_15820 [Bacteroidia bacterium]|nr:hypothetical protein FACS189426_15820 [Bacteroidia bacterium]
MFAVFIAYQLQYAVFTLLHVRQASLTSGTLALNNVNYLIFSLNVAVNSANKPQRKYRAANV